MKEITSEEFWRKPDNILASWLWDIDKANIAKGLINLDMLSENKGNSTVTMNKHFGIRLFKL